MGQFITGQIFNYNFMGQAFGVMLVQLNAHQRAWYLYSKNKAQTNGAPLRHDSSMCKIIAIKIVL